MQPHERNCYAQAKARSSRAQPVSNPPRVCTPETAQTLICLVTVSVIKVNQAQSRKQHRRSRELLFSSGYEAPGQAEAEVSVCPLVSSHVGFWEGMRNTAKKMRVLQRREEVKMLLGTDRVHSCVLLRILKPWLADNLCNLISIEVILFFLKGKKRRLKPR